ncbi:hypothetical protein [Streptomyces sp. NPDC049585]|uniref:hypothetical protein n=1 Tax=Streptomyces sp. NPDC049585 TaxID=3155154 RepID=UPI003414C74A
MYVEAAEDNATLQVLDGGQERGRLVRRRGGRGADEHPDAFAERARTVQLPAGLAQAAIVILEAASNPEPLDEGTRTLAGEVAAQMARYLENGA